MPKAEQKYTFTPGTELLNKLESWEQFHKSDGLRMNKFRASWAEAAVEYFGEITGADVPDLAVPDLLADLMHYCDQHELNFSEELAGAEDRYDEEVSDIGEVYKCQNCGELWSDVDLKPLENRAGNRAGPGEPMPSGKCPECGSVCHPVTA